VLNQPISVRTAVPVINTSIAQTGRLARVRVGTKAIINRVVEDQPDVAHLHDPELLPFISTLKKAGIKVIYDAHEDLPLQLAAKSYVPSWSMPLVQSGAKSLLKRFIKKADAVISVTPRITEKLRQLNKNAHLIANYPRLENFEYEPYKVIRHSNPCYVGSITESRGIHEMIEASSLAKRALQLAGWFHNSALQEEVAAKSNWEAVNFLGKLDRSEVRALMQSASCGLVVLRNIQSYRESAPIKLFEYMANGLPVIASNFPDWKAIIETHQCGLCVEPEDTQKIADTINWVASHPDEAAEMGRNGRKAIEQNYNWEVASKSLLSLYQSLES